MADELSRSVSIEPAWFVVQCHEQRKWVPSERDDERKVVTFGHYETTSPGCGFINAKGRVVTRPAWLTKEDAKRVAARHRRQHRAGKIA